MNYLQKILVFALMLAGLSAWAQDKPSASIKITGVVYNAVSKMPVEVATVQCGDYASTFTQTDGSFTIDVRSSDDIISIIARGFQTKDVFLAGRNTLNIYMAEEGAISFQENAYSGFSRDKQLYSTQAISTVNWTMESTAKLNSSSSESAFDGKVAGLEARSRSGVKGIGSDLFIRGYSSLYANNQPLVIVDGMIYDTESYGSSLINGFRANPLGGIDVGDIENITVVRDANSTYGAKASNGVIYIRTAHAEKQATAIDFSVNGTMELAPDNIPMLGAEDYRLYLNEIFLSKGLTPDSISKMPFENQDPSVFGYYAYHNNTDWQKKVFANNYSSNYRLKIKGGDDVALYALSIGFLQQAGVVAGSNNSRFNFRFNSDINFSQKFTLNSNISFHYLTKNISGIGLESFYDPVYQARVKAPFLQEYVQDEEGTASPDLSDSDFLSISNPVALTKNMMQKDVNYRLFGSFNFNWNLTKDITLSNLIGLSFDKGRQSIFVPNEGVPADSSIHGLITNQMEASVVRHFAINNDFRATYTKAIGIDHNLKLLAGARLNLNTIEQDWAADFNSANDQIQSLGNGNYLLRQKGGLIGDWSNLAYYLDANYSFKNRYLLSLNLALDGSSRYGESADGISLFNTQFGVYPGAAFAWIASAEPFMANIDAIDLLKVRLSYGLTGNDDIGNYTAQKYYVAKNLLSYQGIVAGNMWNPSLGAEKTAKMNVGFDLALFNERLSVSADLFQNKTTNMFDFITANVLSGYSGYYGNMGGFTTSGADFSLNTTLVNKKSLKWTMGMVLSKYATKVDELFDQSRLTSIYGAEILTEVGSPIGLFYGYETNGIYPTDDAASQLNLKNRMSNEDLLSFAGGDVVFVDHNPDGIIDEQDKVVIGDPTPNFTGEIFTRVKHKAFTLDASLAFSYGGDVFNYMRYSLENMSNTNNQTEAVLNRWKFQGQETEIPRAVFGDAMGNSRFSDRWIEDGSYARLKNVTLSYMLPFSYDFLRYIEIYASGYNLFTFSNYLGLDPEFSLNGFALSQGIDTGMIPQNKMVMLGVRIGL